MFLIHCDLSRLESVNQRNLNEILRLGKELEERANTFRSPIQLSFRFPPRHDSPEPPVAMPDDANDLLEQRTLALRNDVVNRPVIEFEKWIMSSSGKLSNFLSSRDAELRTAASDLQLQLGLQAQALRDLTRQNWYHQREQATTEFEVAKLKKPTRSLEFDCSTSIPQT